ncbi:MAG TPA: hypothetical protein VG936_15265 [Lacunisphaera sp.]|nr:hypothetical protein [Lacunisphaera sp.]
MKTLPALVLLFASLLASAAAARLELGAGKALHYVVPDAWTEGDLPEGIDAAGATGHTVRYVTKDGSNDALLLTALTVPDDRLRDPDALRAMAEMSVQQFVAGSVEGKAELKELRFAGVSGLAVTFTDANLVGKPTVKDDYKAMTACFAYLGNGVVITATIFTDDPGGRAYDEAMRVLRSLSLTLPKDVI